ncbi:MAG: hypothetical protein ACI88G_000086 [Woeseiaceae bacterium]
MAAALWERLCGSGFVGAALAAIPSFCTDCNHGELPYAHGSLRCALLRIRQLAVLAVSVLRPLKIRAVCRTRVASPVHETVARRDAGLKPTGTYLRRVSWAGLATRVRVEEHSGRVRNRRLAAKAAPTKPFPQTGAAATKPRPRIHLIRPMQPPCSDLPRSRIFRGTTWIEAKLRYLPRKRLELPPSSANWQITTRNGEPAPH